MLNNIPWIVVKEYFFKNSASTMVDLLKKIMGFAKEAFNFAKGVKNGEDDDVQSAGSDGAKSLGSSLLDAVKKTF